MTFETEIRVRYSETDQMKVVYHANYIPWLEIARVELIREIGLDYKKMEEEGILIPVISLECSYKSPARYDDVVVVQTKIDDISRARMKFSYRIMRKEDGKELLAARSEHTFTDVKLKPINIKKLRPDIWEKLNGCVISI